MKIFFVHTVAFNVGFNLSATRGALNTNALDERTAANDVRTCSSRTNVVRGRLVRPVLMALARSCTSEGVQHRARAHIPITFCHNDTLLLFVFSTFLLRLALLFTNAYILSQNSNYVNLFGYIHYAFVQNYHLKPNQSIKMILMLLLMNILIYLMTYMIKTIILLIHLRQNNIWQ